MNTRFAPGSGLCCQYAHIASANVPKLPNPGDKFMLKNARKIAIAAMLGIGTLAATAATAEAGHRHHGGGGVGIEFRFGESGHSHWRRYDRGRRHGDGDYTNWKNGRHGWGQRCSVDRAVNKAYRMGINHPRVRYADYNVIKIKGRASGQRVSILFSRAPGCPVIGY